MPNLELMVKRDLSSFRRIAIGTWKTAYDPSVYGSLTLRMDKALAYVEAFRARTGRRLTVTHMMAKAIAAVLVETPDANAILRFNRIYLRKDIGVFFQVAMQDAATGQIDLSGTTIHGADQKSLYEIVVEFEREVENVRAQKDEKLEGTRSMFKKIPALLLNTVLNGIGFLAYTLNLDLRALGVPKDPFGSVMVTNIGSLGLEEAYVPLVPYSRVPLLVATGAVRRVPVVAADDTLEIADVMRVFATFDHRILDGRHAASMARILRRWFEDPFAHFDPIDALPSGSPSPIDHAAIGDPGPATPIEDGAGGALEGDD